MYITGGFYGDNSYTSDQNPISIPVSGSSGSFFPEKLHCGLSNSFCRGHCLF